MAGQRQKGETRGSGRHVDEWNCRGGSGWGDHTRMGCGSREDSWGAAVTTEGRTKPRRGEGALGSRSPRSEGGDASVSLCSSGQV